MIKGKREEDDRGGRGMGSKGEVERGGGVKERGKGDHWRRRSFMEEEKGKEEQGQRENREEENVQREKKKKERRVSCRRGCQRSQSQRQRGSCGWRSCDQSEGSEST